MSVFSSRSTVSTALHDLVSPPASNVPLLDVLRSAAILMVISHHSSREWTTTFGLQDAFAKLPFVLGGWRGVDLFFVLSGYLIGRQLWRELRTNGSVNLLRQVFELTFRRWSRQFPGNFQRAGQPATPARRSAGPGPGGE